VAGRLNDTFAAGAGHPAGYLPMMAFFATSGAVGFLLALRLQRATEFRGQTLSRI
jgi:hypothetical protein